MSILRKMRFQPDYFMSAQFAGVAVALRGGAYTRKGIDVDVLPVGEAGEFAKELSIIGQDTGDSLIVGTTEQNILIPAQRAGAPVQAVAAMFGASPLALAALPGRTPWLGDGPIRVGMHEDEIGLMQRLMPHADVVGVGRTEKMGLLADGKVDAIQVYDVMETLKLEHDLGAPPGLVPLEGLGGARLGYAQVLFASDTSVADPERRALLRDFVEATFEGWREAAADPRRAADVVMGLMGEQTDHWAHSVDFHAASVARCCDYVRRARCAGTLGAIDPLRWEEASVWMGGAGGRPSLDASLWAPDPLLADGDSLAAQTLEATAAAAAAVTAARGGRAPTLGLVTVGHGALGHTSEAAAVREGIAPAGQSWFNKGDAGERHGIDVEQLDLPHDTSTEALRASLRELVARCDGIQLMWPLPAHIDSEAAYAVVPAEKDVDGAHFIGASEMRGGSRAAGPSGARGGWMPVTPEAVMKLLEQGGIQLRGKHALVIGRSRIVGSPLAHSLLQAHATVTVAHSATANLQQLCRASDVVISCAGVPGLVRGSWVAPGAVAVSVGSTFCAQTRQLLSDLEPDLEAFRHASLVAGTPGGVGPLSLALLLRNVADAAARDSAAASIGAHTQTPPLPDAEIASFLANSPGWRVVSAAGEGGADALDASVVSAMDAPDGQGWRWVLPPARALVRTVDVPSHHAALELLSAVASAGDELNHHIAHSAVSHRCSGGAMLTMHTYTTSTGGLTAFDVALAREIDAACEALLKGATTVYGTPFGRA